MNYKKLIIVLLILYILYNCFNFKEGLATKQQTDLVKSICEVFIKGNVNEVNILNLDYKKQTTCKDNNFKYTSSLTSDEINKCNSELKTTLKPENIDKNMDISKLGDVMNCRAYNLSEPNKYDKSGILNSFKHSWNNYSDVPYAYTLNNYRILGSYNSSCVSYSSSEDMHSVEFLKFLFNLGVRYFNFNIITKNSEFYISSEPDNDGQVNIDFSSSPSLDNLFETINDVVKTLQPPITRNFNNLKNGDYNGAPNYNDPLIIHLKLCFNDTKGNFVEIFNNIYKTINKNLKNNYYVETSIDKQKKTQSNFNFLFEPINNLKNKIILLIDFISYPKKINKSVKLDDIFKDFLSSNLSQITSDIVSHDLYTQDLQFLKKTYLNKNLSIKSVVVLDTDPINIDNNNIYILEPQETGRCISNNKNNTCLINAKQHFTNGLNIVAFPFYLVNNSKTNSVFLNYYDCFNNNDKNNIASAFQLKTNSQLDKYTCSVSEHINTNTYTVNKTTSNALRGEEITPDKNVKNIKKKLFDFRIEDNN